MVSSVWWMQDWSLVSSSFRTVLRKQKCPFGWRLKGLCSGACRFSFLCVRSGPCSALAAAVWCQHLLPPQGLVWGCHCLLSRETLEWAMDWKWGTGLCLFSPAFAGVEAGRVTDPQEVLCILGLLLLIVKNCSKLCYVVTSQGPGPVSITLPCPEFC